MKSPDFSVCDFSEEESIKRPISPKGQAIYGKKKLIYETQNKQILNYKPQ